MTGLVPKSFLRIRSFTILPPSLCVQRVLAAIAVSASTVMAEDSRHDPMDCKRSSTPLLCANKCGFFGCSATMNLCSKCYKNVIVKGEESVSVDGVVGKPPATMSGKEAGSKAIPTVLLKIDAAECEMVVIAAPVADIVKTSKICSNLVDEQQGFEPAAAPARPNTTSEACLSCGRRIRLYGFKCRCGGLFCAAHRHSDMHKCTFDYKAAARDAISKSNPVVKAEKVQKI